MNPVETHDPPDITKLTPHRTHDGSLQQPMSRPQALHIVANGLPGPHADFLDWNNYAAALYLIGHDADALASAERAVAMERNSTSLLNLGVILEGFGRFMDALVAFAEANRMDPSSVLAGAAYADGLLRLGRWKQGWPYYAHYHSRLVVDRIPTLKDLQDKRILVVRNGGYGDNIYHLRWLRYFREAGARSITFAGPSSLCRLFDPHPWIDRFLPVPNYNPNIEWYASGEPSHSSATAYCLNLNDFDIYLSSMTMGAVVRPQLDNNLWPGYYLKSSPHLGTLARKIAYGKTIGFCWKAGESKFPRPHRTLSNTQAASILLSRPLQEWVNLVPDEPSDKIYSPRIRTWRDTAAIISACDLIVTVDTGVAHLAGALGKPVYVVLPGASAWPYALGEEYMKAYPSMRAFRNPGPGIDSAIGQCVAALEHI